MLTLSFAADIAPVIVAAVVVAADVVAAALQLKLATGLPSLFF